MNIRRIANNMKTRVLGKVEKRRKFFMGKSGKTLPIGGVQVSFPHEKPYGCQYALMSKVIKAIELKQNALLESPTGSGKSLALLCSSLAWQSKEVKKVAEFEPKTEIPMSDDVIYHSAEEEEPPWVSVRDKGVEEHESEPEPEPRKVPRIYFGSRTHSQLAQLVGELRSTSYRPVMTILASRKHYCIYDGKEYTKQTKDQMCENLREYGRCKYMKAAKKLAKESRLQLGGAMDVWDIEDLVSLGNEIDACPYYASREIAKEADLIFAPYNYIIDPIISEALAIKTEGSIVILDEAHNIEDFARESAGFNCTMVDLKRTQTDFGNQRYTSEGDLSDANKYMSDLLQAIIKWLGEVRLVGDGFNSNLSLEGMAMIAALKGWGIEESTLSKFARAYSEISESFNQEQSKKGRKKKKDTVAGGSLKLVEGLLMTLGFCYNVEQPRSNNIECFRLVARRTTGGKNKYAQGRRRPGDEEDERLSLGIWCMAPSVAFTAATGSARSIIVTSGTLAPTESFATELGTEFAQRLEAPHVINTEKQVWVGAINRGPNAALLNTSFKTRKSHAFQDSVGEAILGYCRVIPHGVLCFMPSYSILNDLKKRWESTGLWDKLSVVKSVSMEPRGQDLDVVMEEYYQKVNESVSGIGGGAIFFAVCRGKVAEGLDFADNYARGVLVVGVPFPNVQALEVKLKKEYNSRKQHSGSISGEAWYNLQAYRAVNQAVGRCLRHVHDYGSIVLLDERFCSDGVVSQLSKWLRQSVYRTAGRVNGGSGIAIEYRDSINDLEKFFPMARDSVPPPEPVDTPIIDKPLDTRDEEAVVQQHEHTPLDELFGEWAVYRPAEKKVDVGVVEVRKSVVERSETKESILNSDTVSIPHPSNRTGFVYDVSEGPVKSETTLITTTTTPEPRTELYCVLCDTCLVYKSAITKRKVSRTSVPGYFALTGSGAVSEIDVYEVVGPVTSNWVEGDAVMREIECKGRPSSVTWCERDKVLYRPIICRGCATPDTTLVPIGARVLAIGTVKNSTWLGIGWVPCTAVRERCGGSGGSGAGVSMVMNAAAPMSTLDAMREAHGLLGGGCAPQHVHADVVDEHASKRIKIER